LDDELNVLDFELQVLEHVDEILFGDCLITVLNFLKCCLKLLRVLSDHFSDSQQHVLLLFFIYQSELINDFAQLCQQYLTGNSLGLRRSVAFKTVLNQYFGISLSQVKGLIDEHTFQVVE
jgi:hypothetical protein